MLYPANGKYRNFITFVVGCKSFQVKNPLLFSSRIFAKKSIEVTNQLQEKCFRLVKTRNTTIEDFGLDNIDNPLTVRLELKVNLFPVVPQGLSIFLVVLVI